jgi:HD-like signal output (HDOD) protein
MPGNWLDRLRGLADAANPDAGVPSRPQAGTPPGPEPASQSKPPPTSPLEAIAQWRPRIDVDVAFCRWLIGAPTDDFAGDQSSARALLQTLAAGVQSPRESLTPRVPSLLPQLLHSLRDPQKSVVALSRQVAQDPVLVAAVLRRANSPYYRAGKHIESLEQALLIIGHDSLRHLLAAVAFRPIINVQSGTFTHRAAPIVWEQSERCGMACHVLALAAGTSPFEAFLGALLYNVGTIVLLRELDHSNRTGTTLGSAVFCAGFMDLARDVACTIGRRWQFPVNVLTALPQRAPGDGSAGATALADVLRASDRLSKLRVLVDGERVMRDAALDLDAPIIGACFDKLASFPSD